MGEQMFKFISNLFSKKVSKPLSDSITYFNKNMSSSDKAELLKVEACAHRKRKDWQGALKKLSDALEICPSCTLVWVERADLFYSMGDFQEALEDIEKAVQNDPDCIEAFELRAEIFREMKDLTKMEADQKQITRLKEQKRELMESSLSSSREYIIRGNRKMDEGNLNGALLDFDRAIEMDENCKEAYLNKASILNAQGDVSGAAKYFSKAKESGVKGS